MSRMDDATIREAMARAERATPGPWRYCGAPNCSCGLVWEGTGHFTVATTDSDPDGECIIDTTERKVRDGGFIAAARTDVPALSAEALARGTEVERLRLALREIAICDQDYRPLPGEASPFDWRRRSMKQEDIARKALGGSL